MSLTTGRGPLGLDPAGRFISLEPAGPGELSTPLAAAYVEPFLRRVRGLAGERALVDSQRVLLVHRPGQPPAYAFPEADVSRELPCTPEPAARGYVRVAWDAVSAWYEEEEPVLGHPKNPYHRIDCLRARRRLRVEVASELLVDTADVVALFETAKAPQLYVRREAIRMALLVPSSTTSYCPYKGHASYFCARIGDQLVPDVAWSYEDPTPESEPIRGLLSFYAERTQLTQDVLGFFPVPAPAESHG
jgi:uncharacterized protein (DUF427 family)